MEFQSAAEIKQRVMPALKMKEDQFKRQGFNVTTNEIWEYLRDNKWRNGNNLTLNEIVNDILKLDANFLDGLR